MCSVRLYSVKFMVRTQKAHLSKTIGLDYVLRCFLESFNICINAPEMKLGLNILGEVGIYELRALFLCLLRERFSHSHCKHEDVDIICGQVSLQQCGQQARPWPCPRCVHSMTPLFSLLGRSSRWDLTFCPNTKERAIET